MSCQNTSQRQFVYGLLWKNKLLTFLAVEPVPIVMVSHHHTLPDVRSHGAILQHLKAQQLALLISQTVA